MEVETVEVEVTLRIRTVKWSCPWSWHQVPVRHFEQAEEVEDADQLKLDL